jgi:hypothetical protein
LIVENIGTIESKGFIILREALDRYLNMTVSQQYYVLNDLSKAKRSTFIKTVDSRGKALLDRLLIPYKQLHIAKQVLRLKKNNFA